MKYFLAYLSLRYDFMCDFMLFWVIFMWLNGFSEVKLDILMKDSL
jgi:hypothetical protein